MRILVTGIAGYIGSHIAHSLLEDGHQVVGVDDLSTGRKEFVDPRVSFYKGSVEDKHFLQYVFSEISQPFEIGVIHCAGKKFPMNSVRNPEEYYSVNTLGTFNLLSVMKDFEVASLVFSSSCSIYGEINGFAGVKENQPKQPVSPYGWSKYFAEQIISDSVKTGWLKATSLRYFNVVGNDKIIAHDLSQLNLFPNIYRSISDKKRLHIFGSSYDTRDGTCLRDYVDVRDLSRSHCIAIKKLLSGVQLDSAYNLGSGTGFTVKEVVECAINSIAPNLEVEYDSPRAGDPGSILADTSNAVSDLNWSPTYSLQRMLIDGWEVWKTSKLQSH